MVAGALTCLSLWSLTVTWLHLSSLEFRIIGWLILRHRHFVCFIIIHNKIFSIHTWVHPIAITITITTSIVFVLVIAIIIVVLSVIQFSFSMFLFTTIVWDMLRLNNSIMLLWEITYLRLRSISPIHSRNRFFNFDR